MLGYRGDFALNSIVRFSFNTRDTSGNPITLAGSPALAVYVGGLTSVCNVLPTISVDYNSVTGRHVVTVDTSVATSPTGFYAVGKDYEVVLTAGTVAGVSVVSTVVGSFSINNRMEASVLTAVGSPAQASVLAADYAAMLAAIGTPAQASVLAADYAAVIAAIPSAATIASSVAGVLFVDGPSNRLKVNSDHSINTTVNATNVIYVTVPAAVAVASQNAAMITCVRGDTLRVTLPALGTITGRTKLVMTAKANVTDLDSQAVFQIVEGTGLVTLNGVAQSALTASLTVVDATAGTVNLVISEGATALLAVRDLIWDVQVILPSGVVTPAMGTFSVVYDVTQSPT